MGEAINTPGAFNELTIPSEQARPYVMSTVPANGGTSLRKMVTSWYLQRAGYRYGWLVWYFLQRFWHAHRSGDGCRPSLYAQPGCGFHRRPRSAP